MRFVHHGPDYFVYHLICSLYFVDISVTGVYSGIHAAMEHLPDVKPFDIPPPLTSNPSPRSQN